MTFYGESMKKWMIAATLSAAMMSSALVPSVQAQGFGGGGPGGGMSNSPKRRLTGLLRGIDELEKNKTKALNKAQAKTFIGVITPWKAKPKMSDDEAKAVYTKLNGTLTTSQKNELDKIAAKNRRGFGSGPGGAGGQGGGQGRPGGGPGGGGPGGAGGNGSDFRAQMQKMQGFMKTYNPFYPITKYSEFKTMPDRMKDRMTKSYQSRIALLAKLAAKAK
jgi:hypothetical protein